eukprot:gene3821-14353_t
MDTIYLYREQNYDICQKTGIVLGDVSFKSDPDEIRA